MENRREQNTGVLRSELQQERATAKADPCGMTNKRAGNSNDKGTSNYNNNCYSKDKYGDPSTL
jgi:hypothetical protein